MHILILSKRNIQAQNRLMQSAEALALHFELDPELVTALKPTDKDKDVRALKQREATAQLIEALALKVGAIEQPAPDEPEPEDSEEGVTAVTEPGPSAPEADNLPAPVLDEDVVPIESEPAIEEFPADELPAEEPVEAKKTTKKSVKKSSRKSSKKK